MANNQGNIVVGAAEVAVGTGTPTVAGVDNTWAAIRGLATGSPKDYRAYVNNPTGSPNGVTFVDTGFTQEGVEVQYQPDYGEVEVDQFLDAARLFKQKMTVQVATTFAEPTLENLIVVWDDVSSLINTQTASEKSIHMRPGNLGDAPNERHLLFVGPSPQAVGAAASTKQRAYLASRAVSMDASSHALRRNEATVFPVKFRLLPDTNSSYSAYGKIVDVG